MRGSHGLCVPYWLVEEVRINAKITVCHCVLYTCKYMHIIHTWDQKIIPTYVCMYVYTYNIHIILYKSSIIRTTISHNIEL